MTLQQFLLIHFSLPPVFTLPRIPLCTQMRFWNISDHSVLELNFIIISWHHKRQLLCNCRFHNDTALLVCWGFARRRVGVVPCPWHPAWWEGVQEPRWAQCAVSLMTICPCCRSPTIVTLLRGAPNAGHDLSTSHLTKTVTGPWSCPLCLHCLLHRMRCQCSYCSWCVVEGGPGHVSR